LRFKLEPSAALPGRRGGSAQLPSKAERHARSGNPEKEVPMTTPDPGTPSTPAAGQTSTKVARRQRQRLVAAAILGAVVAAFAVANLEDVKVNWLVTSGQTPLILVIAISFALGFGVDRLLVIRAGRRRKGS
jgi:uncharacterized integral membrane protein